MGNNNSSRNNVAQIRMDEGYPNIIASYGIRKWIGKDVIFRELRQNSKLIQKLNSDHYVYEYHVKLRRQGFLTMEDEAWVTMELQRICAQLNGERKKFYVLFILNNPFNSYSTRLHLYVQNFAGENCLCFACLFLSFFGILLALVLYVFMIFLASFVDIITCQNSKSNREKEAVWLDEMMVAHPDLDTEVMDNTAAASVMQLCELVSQRTGKYVEYSDGLEKFHVSVASGRGYEQEFDTFFIRFFATAPPVSNINTSPLYVPIMQAQAIPVYAMPLNSTAVYSRV